mgnify:CR=1 FL=1
MSRSGGEYVLIGQTGYRCSDESPRGSSLLRTLFAQIQRLDAADLGLVVERVLTCGVIGDVDDGVDLVDVFDDRGLDALAERHLGHAAALAAARHPHVRVRTFDAHEFGESAMRGQGGVDDPSE